MGLIKSLLKSKLHPLVWDKLGQAKQEYWQTKRKYHCEDALIPVFEKYLDFEKGFYVDIGANDGRSSSNTYHLEKTQSWGGVLVEPIMHVFFRSREIRGLADNQFFCCALVDHNYKDQFVELTDSGLLSVASSRVSDFKSLDWAMLGEEFLARGERVQKTWSEARTLESVLIESNAPRIIDFLSVDTEGSEFSIFKDFDFDSWGFRFILIEAAIDSPVYKLLRSNGYDFIAQIHQNLFFANNSF